MTNDPSDPFLVVGITVLILVMLVINVYFLVHYQHPEDKNESYLAKLLILFGFQISAVSVLMLPVGSNT
jgi:LMBR1 domain-containing protein 1